MNIRGCNIQFEGCRGKKSFLSSMKTIVISLATNIETLQRKAHFLEVINAFSSRLLYVNTVDEAVWAVAKHAIAKLGFIDCIVYLIDEEGYLVQRAAHGPKNPVDFDIENPIRLKIGEGICGHVAFTGKAEIIGDTSIDSRYTVDDDRRLSEITVPILSEGKVIGIIDSEHPDANYYTRQDLEILETIASMVSVKIDQARALTEIHKYQEELEVRIAKRTKKLNQTVEKLRVSNMEKETLLQEVHHRVKNNLQVVSSLLNMHANRAKSAEEEQVFRDCQNRILSMSAIHEHLYQKGNLAQINIRNYVEEIARDLLGAFDAKGIVVHQDVEEVLFNIETCVPFGLILNELFVNSLKHAFRSDEGIIHIAVKTENNLAVLRFSDNGSGFELEKTQGTMGLDLIEALAEQIEATVHMESSITGTEFEIRFPFG